MQTIEQITPTVNPLGDKGVDMKRAGFAVLPSKGKSPKIKSYTTMRYAPGEDAIAKMAAKRPTDDLVYVPGLSGPKGKRKGIIVVDADDAETVGKVEDIFGKTPGMVNTRRGKHFLYAAPGVDVNETVGQKVSSLKKFGINADVKHGRSIVAAPPSWHEKDARFMYTWDGCDERVMADLPTFDMKALREIIEPCGNGSLPNASLTARPRPSVFRDGSRKLGLNDWLAGQAWAFETFDEMLAKAHDWNESLIDLGLQPMDADEVMTVVMAIWKDLEAGKLERRHRRRARGEFSGTELDNLLAAPNGGDAFILLAKFRIEHAGRMSRGESFVIVTKAMAEQNTLPGWGAPRIARARDLLLNLGLIRMVKPQRGKRAAEYVLADVIADVSIPLGAGQ